MTVRVERVDASAGLPLRQRVLRPHQTLEELRSPDDDDPETGHYAALVDGNVIATASVRREPPPWEKGDGSAWRLRGMATDEQWRNAGVGARVLEAVVEHVRSHGGGLLWCNARLPALSFYRRAGFRTRGERWVDPEIGPHVAMEYPVTGGVSEGVAG
jgi:GNAT superfamily N-acetyltransferase